MNAGRCSRRQIQGWVANRFYYQENIPRKDAAILANCPDLEVRRRWIRRIIDHDGTTAGEGGIEAWLRLGEAAGLTREEIRDHRHLVPGVRFAVDAYVNFARTRPWVEAVASSLTELFAPDLMAERLAAFERWYRWIDPEGLAYFRARLEQAPRDCEHALEVVTVALPVRRVPGAGRRRAVVQVRRPVELDGRRSTRPTRSDRHGPAHDRNHDPIPRRGDRIGSPPAGAPCPAVASAGPGSGTSCSFPRRSWCCTAAARTSSSCATGGAPSPRSWPSWARGTRPVPDDEVRRFLTRLVARRCVELPRVPRTRMDSPFGLLAELTYRCPLACAYCSNPLNMADYTDELTTDEWRRVLVEAARPGRSAVPPVRRGAAAAARPGGDRGDAPTTWASTPTS